MSNIFEVKDCRDHFEKLQADEKINKESKMDEAVIKWSSVIPYSNLENSTNSDLDKEGFYMILTGIYNASRGKYTNIELQYIGKSETNIRERILDKHEAYPKINEYLEKHQGYEALIKPGIIVDTSQERITTSFFNHIEACLIFRNQPLANEKNKDSYNGRDILVKNIGNYSPLEEESKYVKTS